MVPPWQTAHDDEQAWRSRGEAAIRAEMERRLALRTLLIPPPPPSLMSQLRWWTNGTHEIKSLSCPPDWHEGRTTRRRDSARIWRTRQRDAPRR